MHFKSAKQSTFWSRNCGVDKRDAWGLTKFFVSFLPPAGFVGTQLSWPWETNYTTTGLELFIIITCRSRGYPCHRHWTLYDAKHCFIRSTNDMPYIASKKTVTICKQIYRRSRWTPKLTREFILYIIVKNSDENSSTLLVIVNI